MGLFSTSVIAQTGPPIDIDYLIIAGGGGAQAINSGGTTGGGGAGGFLSGSATVTPGYTDLSISVGPGGLRTFGATVGDGEGNDGNNSTFLGLTAIGGGGGGNKTGGNNVYTGPGRNGGSGGGAGASGLTSPQIGPYTGSGGTGSVGQGFNGGGSFTFGNTNLGNQQFRGGSGGGAGGAANDAANSVSSIPGIEKAWLDGFKYAGGGAAQLNVDTNTTSGSGGRTQNNTTVGTEGKNGLVKLRYSSSVALFTGGEINISGGYVYHSFNVGTQPAFAPGVNTDYTLYYTGG
jgi:hypothetical protein